MSGWAWAEIRDVLAIHEAQLTEHGGADGVRDMGGLESALARPLNRTAYGETSLAALASAYAFGIAKNHPFIDGNKRTAFVTLEYFLELNGFTLTADDVQCVVTMLGVADGSVPETELAGWIEKHIARS